MHNVETYKVQCILHTQCIIIVGGWVCVAHIWLEVKETYYNVMGYMDSVVYEYVIYLYYDNVNAYKTVGIINIII